MKTIKPIYIALFILFVLSLLGGLLFLSSKNINSDKEGFFFKDYMLKYPLSNTFFEIEVEEKNTKKVIEKITKTITPLEVEINNKIINTDTILKNKIEIIEKKELVTKIDFSKIDTLTIQRINYPESNLLFLDELKEKLKSKDCRIIHYGDSQLEGDRITGYLRNRLQKMYGGSGPGFIPIKQAYHQISAKISHSENWERNALFDPTQKKFEHKKYGAYLSSSRFTPSIKDSFNIDTIPTTKATIEISKSNITYRKFRAFNNIGLHYSNCNYPVSIKVYNKDQLIAEDSLVSDGNYHNYKIKLTETPVNLKIELEGKVSADFYGLTLDGSSGVQIDNVAMRGASGTHFSRNNYKDYTDMLTELNPKIMILQYGGNTVPYLKDSIRVDNYIKRLNKQVNWLRRRKNNMSFLFIGPTDLVTSINGEMKTYKILPYLNEQLKTFCSENNVAFWDMFNAMGGKNSMPTWVDEKLAGGDYIHFTPKGTRYISELFFTSLYLDIKPKK